ncbi:DAK2 domain-containing protein [uncultured Thomasclavelia sp.]|uniref:DAK2 domain-containing protein n=1 Tax=uncultured Thomasclavelia sp. TaxID=3025759 RepID=UPI0025F64E33|nr:DAK2 domain-containing protein [uncultured Thomasclavelia sp.]
MKIVTGELFKEMVLCGANTLHNNYPEIDALNVFPVPDGDTGTNMSLTFSAGAKEVDNFDSNNIGDISKKLSKGLLMGARGNSGVILSQIFRGVSMTLQGHEDADAMLWSEALQSGAKVAYKAVMKPVEGTILTVIREASEAAAKYVKPDMEIEDFFSYFVKEAQLSLDRTPELLPVLKEVGVVDSGGAGLLLVFTGFMAALAGERVDYVEIKSADNAMNAVASVESGEEGYGYCTEFIIRLEPSLINKFKEDQLKKELERLPGNSIVVVQDEDIVKVHVHTLKPGNALNIAQRFGEFVKIKIENMQEQNDALQARQSIVGVDDNKEKEKAPAKETAVISVCAGEGLKNAFLELHCDYVVNGGQTMNPSAEDMVQAVKRVNAKNVIILPNNSNIVMTAQQTATILEGEINVIVIPTKTIPQGLSACIMYNPDAPLDDNIADMTDAAENVKTGQVTYAIKDTSVDGIEIKANDYMALVEKNIVACKDDKLKALEAVFKNIIDNDSEIITLICGEDVNDGDVEEVESYVEDNYDIELEVINGQQPVYSFIVGVE